jgi:hypothetical protein
MGGPMPFNAASPQPIGAPVSNMGMQPFSPAAQPLASTSNAQAPNNSKRVILIVVIAVGVLLLVGIVATILALTRG